MRGIRSDVVAGAARDQGAQRPLARRLLRRRISLARRHRPADGAPSTLNASWGGVIEPNSFGTHEFFDFAEQIGSEAFVSVNVGLGNGRRKPPTGSNI